MNKPSILLIPAIGLLVCACASSPGLYSGGGYGPGPNPQSGYYWNGTVYVHGSPPWDHGNQYDRNVTNVNDVDVNRTVVNDRTVNKTNVNDRTNVNNSQADHKNAKPSVASNKAARKHVQPENKEKATAKPTPTP